MDNVVFKKTEVRKNIMAEKHMKWHAREKSIYGKSSAYKKQQKKTGQTVNTVHISSDFSTNLPPTPNTEKTKLKWQIKSLKRRANLNQAINGVTPLTVMKPDRQLTMMM